jgi:hypothetical protein
MLLLLLFLFFIIANVSDMRTGKVRNKDILVFLFLGVVYYSAHTARELMAGNPSVLLELRFAGINLLLAFVVSFLVRSAGIWPAGDAKTYVVANLLIPLASYKHIYFTYFPGFTLLINIFIAGIVYILLKSAATFFTESLPAMSVQASITILKHSLNKLSTQWGSYLKTISSYLIVYFIMNFIGKVITSETRPIAQIAPEIFLVALFFAMRVVGTFVNRRLKAINHIELYLLFIIFALFLNQWSMEDTGRMLVQMSVSAILFLCFYGAIQYGAEYYINKAQTTTVDLNALKEGDLPTNKFLDSLPPDARTQISVSPEGLDQNDLHAIVSTVSSSQNISREIPVYKPTPFVPIIFAGVLFTVITGISTVQYLKQLIFH